MQYDLLISSGACLAADPFTRWIGTDSFSGTYGDTPGFGIKAALMEGPKSLIRIPASPPEISPKVPRDQFPDKFQIPSAKHF